MMCHTEILLTVLRLSGLCAATLAVESQDEMFVTDDKLRSYRLEDFFWTGSGDELDMNGSANGEDLYQPKAVTTVFHTTTILFATLYPSAGSTPQVSPVWTESIDLSSPVLSSSVPEIQPTPAMSHPMPPRTSFSVVPSSSVTPPDQKYWLLTVLRTEPGAELRMELIEQRLATLYQRAFIRSREKAGQVRVLIHNVSRDGVSGSDVGLIYTVSVTGQVIPALSAASDMRLLTMSEVSAEMGYPVLTKAAPYLKGVIPAGARVRGRSRDTWMLIGSVVAAVSLLVVLAALFTLGLSKKRTQRSARGAANRRQVYDGREGTTHLGFADDTVSKGGRPSDAPGTVTFAEQRRGSSASSSCSGSSEASLVRLRQQHTRREVRPQPRPRTRVRRIQESPAIAPYCQEVDLMQCGRSGEVPGSPEDPATPHTVTTPTSYLSMPSVKAFPRKARIPEPLNRVLDPISIRHLDMDEPGPVPRASTRHGSLEADDPGIIGPMVWNKNAFHGEADSVGRMRRRFSDLLDDAFTPRGEEQSYPPPVRAKSAHVISDDGGGGHNRPRSSAGTRPEPTRVQAWTSQHPRVDPQLVLVDAQLPPTDPALPLITAIKEQLKKFQTPQGCP